MILIDANVLLEVILRRAHAKACEQLLINDKNKAISTLTLDLVMYFVERDKLEWEPVKVFLESFSWLPITDSDAQWAFMNFKGNDFEDALQVACAIREGCSRFITLDVPLSKKYAQNIAIDLIR
ncbi:MAG: PIN domain-containing protein [Candidatus Saccharibacteria bacterium]